MWYIGRNLFINQFVYFFQLWNRVGRVKPLMTPRHHLLALRIWLGTHLRRTLGTHLISSSIEVENSYIPFRVFWKNRKKQLINLKDIVIILLFGLIKVNWQYTKWNTKLKLISLLWKMCGLCWNFCFGCGCKGNWGIEFEIAIMPLS